MTAAPSRDTSASNAAPETPAGLFRAEVDFGACEQPLTARFEDVVARHPNQTAIDDGDLALTYSVLNARANRIARTIVDRLGQSIPDDRNLDASPTVALLVDSGAPLSIALLGALKADRAFVPLDPTHPAERLKTMIDESKAQLVLTQDRHLALARDVAGALPVLCLDTVASDVSADNLPTRATPASLAYVLYTSGSTGRPKGVMQDHRSVLHNVLRHTAHFDYTERDRQTMLYPPNVYGGIRDTLNALLHGATLCHYPLKQLGHAKLGQWLLEKRITIFCSVTSVFRHFCRELSGTDLFPSLRVIKMGGEATHRTDVELFQKHFCAHTMFHVGLGSTETGMTRSNPMLRSAPIDFTTAPLGWDMAGIELLLLDENHQPVAPGDVGEIAFKSRYVTRGYRGREDLNAKCMLSSSTFSRVPTREDIASSTLSRVLAGEGRVGAEREESAEDGFDVAPGLPGETLPPRESLPFGETLIPAGKPAAKSEPLDEAPRIFLTGDLGQLREDGCLVHRGRRDHQVKIRGNRVELPEIEATLRTAPHLHEAAVIAKTDDAGDAKLFAYFVAAPDAPADAITPSTLRAHLRKTLPAYMAPHAFIRLDKLPQTSNGKIDRKSLPDPSTFESSLSDADLDGADDVELILIDRIKAVLKRDRVGRHDDFFDLGGDSLSVVKLILEVEKSMGRTLPIAAFYDNPTPLRLSWHVRRDGKVATTSKTITLKPGRDDLAPLICLPGRGGTAFTYRALADRLEIDRAIVGLQYPGLDGREKPIDNLPALASELVRRIRAIRPNGPRLLLGYSYGGMVGFEIARQLREAGEQVPYFAIIDTAAPGAIVNRPRHERLMIHAGRFWKLSAKEKLDYVKSKLRRRKRRSAQPAKGTEVLTDFEDPFAKTQGAAADWLRDLRRAADAARDAYQPRPLDVAIHLIRTTERPEWLDFCRIDPHYGWARLAEQGVITSDISARHEHVFHAKHVTTLAQHIRAALRPFDDR